MAGYLNTIPLNAPIAPRDTRSRYPTHWDQFGLGGYRTVDLLSERDAIPNERKKEGMLVYVVENDSTYRLTLGLWEEVHVKLVIESEDSSVSFSDIDKLKIDTNSGLYFSNDAPNSVTLTGTKSFDEIRTTTDNIYAVDSNFIKFEETLTVKPSILGNSIKFKTKGYTYSSDTAKITHFVHHNLGTNILICNIYIKESNGSLTYIIASHKILDLNTIEINTTTARDIVVNVIPLEPTP